jgi:hypothetical protein
MLFESTGKARLLGAESSSVARVVATITNFISVPSSNRAWFVVDVLEPVAGCP